jgi:AmmeMemoRadiSam system protein B
MAGRFYPADPDECQRQAMAALHRTKPSPALAGARPWIGGIVPHAGWVCSGAIAGQTIATIARTTRPDVVVVFGAIHTPLPLEGAALDTHARWSVPGGETALPTEVSTRLAETRTYFHVDARFHDREHAVEVELPLLQQAFLGKPVLPIEVAPDDDAPAVGRAVAKVLADLNLSPVFLASSDLTHYGPDYHFTPAGIGAQALDWAMDNDRRVLELVTRLADEYVVPEVHNRFNACGAGAIAAMLAACKAFGATSAEVLRHTNSFEILFPIDPQAPTNAVGYASVVVG